VLEARDVHWFAGLMEGEGWFGLTNHRVQQLRVQLISTDKDVVDRAGQMFGFGVRAERLLPSGKTAYNWTVSTDEEAAGLMMTLLPLMGQRRSADIMACLDVWKSKPPHKRRWTHCLKGHPLSGDNLFLYQEGKYLKRRCKQCTADRQTKYRMSL
jgi:hypothetical protein